MIHRQLPPRTWSIAVLLLAGFAVAPPAQAQDDDNQGPAAAAVAPGNEIAIDDSTFDLWIFGAIGGGRAAARRAAARLTLEIAELERDCQLSAVQKKKLMLAGRGDIKRLFDKVDALKSKYVKIDMNNQAQYQKMWEEITPLTSALQNGLFDEGSLYTKMLQTTLKPGQIAKHEEAARDRMLYRYQALIEQSLEEIAGDVGLTDHQIKQLHKCIDEEIQPPRKLGETTQYLAHYQLSRIPREKIRPICNDIQWRYLERLIDQGRANEGAMKAGGFVPTEETEDQAKPQPVAKKE